MTELAQQTEPIKDFQQEVLCLKTDLCNLESEISKKLLELENQSLKWDNIETRKKDILSMIPEDQDELILNIGGKKFNTRIRTLLSVNDNIFYTMIVSGRASLKNEIFVDRSPKFFGVILNYLRTKSCYLKDFNTDHLIEIKREASFYELLELVELINEELKVIKVVGLAISGPFLYQNMPISENKLESIQNLEDTSGMNGIATNSPGWVIFTLNKVTEISKISIMGYKGNLSFSNNNGGNSKILIGTDLAHFKEVGLVPASFNHSIAKVIVNKVKGNCIKILGTSNVGIGYFKVE